MVANTIPWLPHKTNLLISFNCRNYTNNSKQIIKLFVMGFSPQKKNNGKLMYKHESLLQKCCANKRFIVLPNTEQGTRAG